jgi:hypothetical protein
MLLEDMGEIARFSGSFEQAGVSGPAEIRLYKSNLAVLPAASAGFQWRLADVDELKFDASTYEVVLQSGEARLKFSRLARRTEELAVKISEAMNALATQTAQALHGLLPFLDPDQLQACARILREGRSASLAKLTAIHRQIPVALAANAVDKDLKPYYDALVARAAAGAGYAGFKLIHGGAEDGAASHDDKSGPDDQAADDGVGGAPDADADAPQTLYWFLFPIAAKAGRATPANVVAWEASSRSGRATYFFRLIDPAQAGRLSDPAVVDASVRRLNRVLAMLNFRRRPIYLSDDELAMDPKFHRYAIAARRIAEVREVRASFLGRAAHTSMEAWQAQVEGILGS